MKNTKYLALLAIPLAALGIVGSAAFAQTASSQATTAPVSVAQKVVDPVDTQGDAAEPKTHGHRPLGGDGVVAAITGTTLTMAEESDEGSASYTVDASKATISKDGVAATLSDIKVGDKVFVDGTTSGTTVVATTVSLGHPGDRGHDGNEGPETNDGPDGGPTDGGN